MLIGTKSNDKYTLHSRHKFGNPSNRKNVIKGFVFFFNKKTIPNKLKVNILIK